MYRQKGIANVSFNFEPHSAAPLDARAVVATKADLTNENTFLSTDGLSYAYKGMIVSVTDDETTENNGLYILKGTDTTSEENWEKAGAGGSITTSSGIASVLDNSQPVNLFATEDHISPPPIDSEAYTEEASFTENSTEYSSGSTGIGYYYISFENEYDDDHLYTITLREHSSGPLDIFVGEMTNETHSNNLPPQNLVKLATIQLGDSGDLVTFTFDGTDEKVTYINSELVDFTGYPLVPKTTTNRFLFAKDPGVESGTFVLGESSGKAIAVYSDNAWTMISDYVSGWDIVCCRATGEPSISTEYTFDKYLVDSTTNKVRSGVIQNIIDNGTLPNTTPGTASVIDGGKAKNLFGLSMTESNIEPELTPYASTYPAHWEQNAQGFYISLTIYMAQQDHAGSNMLSVTVKDMSAGPCDVFLWAYDQTSQPTLPNPSDLTKLFTLQLTGDEEVKEFKLDGTDDRVTINPTMVNPMTGYLQLPSMQDGMIVVEDYYAESQGTIAYMDPYAQGAPQDLQGYCFNNGELSPCDPIAFDIKIAVESDDQYNFDQYIYDEDNDEYRSNVISSINQSVDQINSTLNTESGIATVLDGGAGKNLFNETEKTRYDVVPGPIAQNHRVLDNLSADSPNTPENYGSYIMKEAEFQNQKLYSFTLGTYVEGTIEVHLVYMNSTYNLSITDLPYGSSSFTSVSASSLTNSKYNKTLLCTLNLVPAYQTHEYLLDGTDPLVTNINSYFVGSDGYIQVPNKCYLMFKDKRGNSTGRFCTSNSDSGGYCCFSASDSRTNINYQIGITFKKATVTSEEYTEYQFDEYLVDPDTGNLHSGVLEEIKAEALSPKLPSSPENIASVVDNGEYVNLFDMEPYTEQRLVPTDTSVGLIDSNSQTATPGGENSIYFMADDQIELQGKPLYSMKIKELAAGTMDVYIIHTGITSGKLTTTNVPAIGSTDYNNATKFCTLNFTGAQDEIQEFVLDGTDTKVTYINSDYVDSTGLPVLPSGYHFAFKGTDNTSARFRLNNHMSGTAVANTNTIYYYVFPGSEKINKFSDNIGIEFKVLDYQEVIAGYTSTFDTYLTDTDNHTIRSNILNDITTKLNTTKTVSTKANLTSITDAYKGMTVTVTDDTTASNNGLYMLTDADATVAANWTKIGGDDVVMSVATRADLASITSPYLGMKVAVTNEGLYNNVYTYTKKYITSGSFRTRWLADPFTTDYDYIFYRVSSSGTVTSPEYEFASFAECLTFLQTNTFTKPVFIELTPFTYTLTDSIELTGLKGLPELIIGTLYNNETPTLDFSSASKHGIIIGDNGNTKIKLLNILIKGSVGYSGIRVSDISVPKVEVQGVTIQDFSYGIYVNGGEVYVTKKTPVSGYPSSSTRDTTIDVANYAFYVVGADSTLSCSATLIVTADYAFGWFGGGRIEISTYFGQNTYNVDSRVYYYEPNIITNNGCCMSTSNVPIKTLTTISGLTSTQNASIGTHVTVVPNSGTTLRGDFMLTASDATNLSSWTSVSPLTSSAGTVSFLVRPNYSGSDFSSIEDAITFLKNNTFGMPVVLKLNYSSSFTLTKSLNLNGLSMPKLTIITSTMGNLNSKPTITLPSTISGNAIEITDTTCPIELAGLKIVRDPNNSTTDHILYFAKSKNIILNHVNAETATSTSVLNAVMLENGAQVDANDLAIVTGTTTNHKCISCSASQINLYSTLNLTGDIGVQWGNASTVTISGTVTNNCTTLYNGTTNTISADGYCIAPPV